MGSASWSHSFDALSEGSHGSRHVYAIDWPSWGLSCREQSFPSGQGTEICRMVEADSYGLIVINSD